MKSAAALHTHRDDRAGRTIVRFALFSTVLLLLLFGVLGMSLATYIYNTLRSVVEEAIPSPMLSLSTGADAAARCGMRQVNPDFAPAQAEQDRPEPA